jgi:transcriptional regulator GlxA family with amidase domain
MSHQVVVLAYEGAELLDIAAVTSALDLANRLGADPAYRVVLASVGGGEIRCDSGLSVRAHVRLSAVLSADTIIVSGGRGHTVAADDRALVRHLRRLAEGAQRVGSVCTGATLLAEAGLLDGRRATTHWLYADELAARYPAVLVDASPIFIREGRIATSGGVTASLDLTLALIEEDHGAELARRVAMGMVTYLQRPGNQAQMSMFTTSPRPDHAALRDVLDHVVAHPNESLTSSTLAARAGVSVRQLNRLFQENVGEPPAAAVRRIRLEIAARLLTTTDVPVSHVARRCGFSSSETLRQAFVSRFGVAPRTFRQTQGGVAVSGRRASRRSAAAPH